MFCRDTNLISVSNMVRTCLEQSHLAKESSSRTILEPLEDFKNCTLI